ncbi:amidohydrolase family protein [Sphingomonas tabacisoli]|uniref:Amidohydrolase family protein n=1 Tax=Sphingomonas tabacisoli TaxID=2249466 RepID=A0ABW4I1Z4_9SPHN
MRFRLLLLIAALLAAPASAAPDPSVLYSDATVIDGTGARAGPHVDILVAGERIAQVGPHGTIAAAGARIVDLQGRYVIPGLIDSHVHLATPPDRKEAEAVLRRNLYGGVTAVRDMADDLRAVAELAREAEQGEIAAPDIVFAALMAGRPFFADPRVAAASRGWKPGTAPWMQAIDGKTDLRLAVARAKGTGAAAIKIYADLPPNLVAAITAEAHRQGMLVWAHSAVFPTRPADVIAAGPDAISHVCYLAYQVEPVMLAAYEDHTPVYEERLAAKGDDPVMAKLFAEMKRRGIVLDATGSLFMKADPAHPKRCTGPTTARLTAQAYRAGVTISAGTDSDVPPGTPWPPLHDEIFFLVHNAGVPPLQAIKAATIDGAKAMGRDRDLGSIEPGKLADFVVLSKDPLAEIENLRSVELTVKRGRDYPHSDYRVERQ